jgi:hypothetical protein
MHGVGFEQAVDTWFEMPDIPKTKVARNKIAKVLRLL